MTKKRPRGSSQLKRYDIIVIGGGGGVKISSPAAAMGLKAAIIEDWKPGGTCLNRGCIPSKMLIHPSNVAHAIKESKKFGITAKTTNVNFSWLVRHISKIVDGESAAIDAGWTQNPNLDYYRDHARFLSDNVLEVGGKRITAKKIFIATGARPSVPPIPGLDKTPYMTSTEALRLTKQPKKLLVIGGGYIACELGNAYGQLGTEAHFIVRGSEMLRNEDQDVRETFAEELARQHTVHFSTSPTKVEYKNKTFTLTLKTKSGKTKKLSGDALLVATGVKPNSDDLGLENTSVKTDKRGFIRTNSYLETGARGVYAMGDVAGKYLFRHSVNYEGEHLFDTLFVEKRRKPVRYPPMPHAVFTAPEVAGVGVREDDLIAKGMKEGKDYVVGLNPYRKSAMGMARLSHNEFVKLIFDRKTRKLIGAHILGEEASTMIHQLIYAMTFNATVDKLLDIIYIHPALPEVVRNAARIAKAEMD